MTINGVAATPATFLTTLNAQLGGTATASFTDGKLSLTATGANGVVIADDATSPSGKAGRGFSHYFGMNDLITTDRPATYDIGLTAGSLHGFTAGETVPALRPAGRHASARPDRHRAPGTGSMSELLTAMNNPVTGVGRYGTFVLDTSGSVVFKGNTDPAATMSVIQDTTTQVPSGVSMTELFGLGSGVRSPRAADGFSVRADISGNPMKLALAQLNLSATAGTTALASGDGRGALAWPTPVRRRPASRPAAARRRARSRCRATPRTVSGDIGARAAAAKTRAASADAVHTEAQTRQTAYEGVNLDEELVNMTTFQQSFNASARLIQAVKDMYDTLLGMVQ
jgi:flagellar hook-associated protein 1 FlgK